MKFAPSALHVDSLAQAASLPLLSGLNAKTQQLCSGLASGRAAIYQWVTPVTAALLHWWFDADCCAGRPFNFHAHQRQAILNLVVAHEVLGATTLLDLYRQVAWDALLSGTHLLEIARPLHAHPKYCLQVGAGGGSSWVLQALLIWQFLNKATIVSSDLNNHRFTQHCLVVASTGAIHQQLLQIFCGSALSGAQDFSACSMARRAELLLPDKYRNRMLDCMQQDSRHTYVADLTTIGNGMVTIVDGTTLSKAGRDSAAMHFLADLPNLAVFNIDICRSDPAASAIEAAELTWQKSLNHIAMSKGRNFIQIDFSSMPYNLVDTGRQRRALYFPHVITDFDLHRAMVPSQPQKSPQCRL